MKSQSPAPEIQKARMSPEMARSDELERSEPGSIIKVNANGT